MNVNVHNGISSSFGLESKLSFLMKEDYNYFMLIIQDTAK
jgi:hypothetical protein